MTEKLSKIWIVETPIEVDCIESAINCLINHGNQCIVWCGYEKDPNTPEWSPHFLPPVPEGLTLLD